MAEIEDNVDRELFRNIEKLRALRIEHRDLDEVIARLIDGHAHRRAAAEAPEEAQAHAEGPDHAPREPADPRPERLIARLTSALSASVRPSMIRADSAVQTIFAKLASPEVLAELIAMVIAGADRARRCTHSACLAQAPRRNLHRAIRLAGANRRKRPCCSRRSWWHWSCMLIVRGMLGSMAMHTAVIDTALQLTTALVLVRLGRVSAAPVARTAMAGSAPGRTRLTFVLWLHRQLRASRLVRLRREHARQHRPHPRQQAQFSLWALLKGMVVITGFVLVTSLIARAIERRVMKLEAIAVSTRIGISKFTYFFLVSLGILLGINAAGVDVTTLKVLTGAIGLGLGFGLQAIASNFVSGFVLLMDKSIKPGDVISFTGHTGTSTENFGWVQELRGRYVVVRDRDGVETLVPNQNLITNSVINWSYSDQRVRLRLPVMISYDDDPEVALKAAVRGGRRTIRASCANPRPVTRLMSFEDYGMRLEVRFWIADPMNGVNNVRSDVNRAIWRVFKQHGIKIPVAQREFRMLDKTERLPTQLTVMIEIPASDVHLSFVRSSGPGGQNVNKVASAVQLRFDLAGTANHGRTGQATLARARGPATDGRRVDPDHRAESSHPGGQSAGSLQQARRAHRARAGGAQGAQAHQAYARITRASAGRQGAIATDEEITRKGRLGRVAAPETARYFCATRVGALAAAPPGKGAAGSDDHFHR